MENSSAKIRPRFDLIAAKDLIPHRVPGPIRVEILRRCAPQNDDWKSCAGYAEFETAFVNFSFTAAAKSPGACAAGEDRTSNGAPPSRIKRSVQPPSRRSGRIPCSAVEIGITYFGLYENWIRFSSDGAQRCKEIGRAHV